MKPLNVFLLLFFLVLSACDETREKQEPVRSPVVEEVKKGAEKVPQKKVEIEVEVRREITDPNALKRGSDEQIQLLVQAKSALFNDDWDKADAIFEKIVKTEPLSGEKITAYIALANSYRDSKKPKKAVALLKELSLLGEKIAEVQFVLARSYAELGESTASIKAYEYTIKIQPDYLQAIVELAGAYLKAGRKEESEKMFYEYEKKIHNYSKVLESDVATKEEQLQVIDVFNFLDDERANKAIVHALGSRYPDVRESAISLVRDFRLSDSKIVLDKLKQIKDEDPDLRVRMMAKDAILLIGKK